MNHEDDFGDSLLLLLHGTVPSNNCFLDGTVPSNNLLFDETLKLKAPSYNLFLDGPMLQSVP